MTFQERSSTQLLRISTKFFICWTRQSNATVLNDLENRLDQLEVTAIHMISSSFAGLSLQDRLGTVYQTRICIFQIKFPIVERNILRSDLL